MISHSVSIQGGEVLHHRQLPEIQSGTMEVRLAVTQEEVDQAQSLRYQVFYEECKAVPSAETLVVKRDFDSFDDYCDHLLVIDHARGGAIVGTYRFMLRDAALRRGKYFSSSEFDVSKLVAVDGEIMELGRSCVHKDYRNRPTMELLWRGIGGYIEQNQVKILFGCASFWGIDISKYRQAMAYLYHEHLAPEELRTRALPELYQDMNTIAPENINVKEALRELPPLIKGYLRMGGFVGDGAIIDPQFNTIDVCVIVKSDLMVDRYAQRYRGQPGISESM